MQNLNRYLPADRRHRAAPRGTARVVLFIQEGSGETVGNAATSTAQAVGQRSGRSTLRPINKIERTAANAAVPLIYSAIYVVTVPFTKVKLSRLRAVEQLELTGSGLGIVGVLTGAENGIAYTVLIVTSRPATVREFTVFHILIFQGEQQALIAFAAVGGGVVNALLSRISIEGAGEISRSVGGPVDAGQIALVLRQIDRSPVCEVRGEITGGSSHCLAPGSTAKLA